MKNLVINLLVTAEDKRRSHSKTPQKHKNFSNLKFGWAPKIDTALNTALLRTFLLYTLLVQKNTYLLVMVSSS